MLFLRHFHWHELGSDQLYTSLLDSIAQRPRLKLTERKVKSLLTVNNIVDTLTREEFLQSWIRIVEWLLPQLSSYGCELTYDLMVLVYRLRIGQPRIIEKLVAAISSRFEEFPYWCQTELAYMLAQSNAPEVAFKYKLTKLALETAVVCEQLRKGQTDL